MWKLPADGSSGYWGAKATTAAGNTNGWFQMGNECFNCIASRPVTTTGWSAIATTGPMERSAEMRMEIVLPKRRNDPEHWEYWMRDPGGYTVVVASPD